MDRILQDIARLSEIQMALFFGALAMIAVLVVIVAVNWKGPDKEEPP